MSDIQPTNTELVFAGSDGEPFTTSLVIANETGNEHRAVIQLIRNYVDDLNEVGTSAFQMQKSGGRPTEYAELDEPAAALLMTYLKNTPVVRDFKKRLIAGFYAMRQKLTERPAIDGNSITRMELIEIARNAEMERLVLESENRELAPKAEAYDSFLDATGKYAVGAVAQNRGGRGEGFNL